MEGDGWGGVVRFYGYYYEYVMTEFVRILGAVLSV